MLSENIGNIHPLFFDCSKLFKKMKVVKNNEGVELSTPFFVLTYSFDTHMLSCEDGDVLSDFVSLIKDAYGSKMTRKELYDTIDWNNIKEDWSILNVGTCVLNDTSGWDGSLNAIWFDNNNPGDVITVQAQFWNRKLLFDITKSMVVDLSNLFDKSVIMPNLVEALLHNKENEEKHNYIQNLISIL